MTAEVVQLTNAPSLRDVPNRLRKLADDIEAGEYGEVPTVFVVVPKMDDYPDVFGYGDNCEQNDVIVALALAHHNFLSMRMSR